MQTDELRYRVGWIRTPALAKSQPDDGDDEDLDEKLDRDRHGSGEFEPGERYGRRDVEPDRERRTPGDEDEEGSDEGSDEG